MQARELIARLEAAGVLKGGQLSAERRATVILLPSDQQRAHGIIEYLRTRRRLSLLRPLFAAHPNDPFAASSESPSASRSGGPWRLSLSRDYGESGSRLAAAIRERLGLDSQYGSVILRVHFSVVANDPAVLPLDGPRMLVGSLHLWSGNRSAPASREVKGADGHFNIGFDGSEVTVRDVASGRTAQFDLKRSRELLERAHANYSATAGPRTPLILKPTGGDLPSELILTGASGERDDLDGLKFRSINFSVLIAR